MRVESAPSGCFDAEMQQRQKHDDRFLFVPGDVVGNGQLVDVGKPQRFLRFQRKREGGDTKQYNFAIILDVKRRNAAIS